jgi:hypothetical protein
MKAKNIGFVALALALVVIIYYGFFKAHKEEPSGVIEHSNTGDHSGHGHSFGGYDENIKVEPHEEKSDDHTHDH